VIIVSGKIYVDAAARSAYLAGCQGVMVQARAAAGCLDFHLSADPLEEGRINVFESWESAAALEAFRGSGPSSGQTAQIREAHVFQHEVATSAKL
jgi:quinol monooxygenase YgiN